MGAYREQAFRCDTYVVVGLRRRMLRVHALSKGLDLVGSWPTETAATAHGSTNLQIYNGILINVFVCMSDQQGATDLFQRAPSDRTRHLNAAVEITEELWSPLAKQHSKNCEFSFCTNDIQRVSSQGMLLGLKQKIYVYTTMQFTCMLYFVLMFPPMHLMLIRYMNCAYDSA